MRAREYGFTVGSMPCGQLNKITDVPGVLVGHTTINENGNHTGVTVILPGTENPFTNKLPCASFVLNGFGKTLGLVQVNELGSLETPIALTNTLNVGLVHDAVVGYMIDRCRADGIRLTSVNPVVCECNDASLNDIQLRSVRESHVRAAINAACADFEEGAVGCGAGMTCHGFKGGVGSASRIVELNGEKFTVGILAQTNHGRQKDLTFAGKPVGQMIADYEELPDKGSCIMILATDAPLSDRQLRRVITRCSVGLARLGSYIGHGSGEVFIGFSTANRIKSDADDLYVTRAVNESRMELFFRAAAECAEEAVLNSLFEAKQTRHGDTVRRALPDCMKEAGLL